MAFRVAYSLLLVGPDEPVIAQVNLLFVSAFLPIPLYHIKQTLIWNLVYYNLLME